MLMTQDVVPGTRSKSYTEQKKLIEENLKKTPLLIGGEVPTLLEATTSILMEYVRKGKRLYSDIPGTATRCQEVIHEFQGVVGGFSSDGLNLHFNTKCGVNDNYVVRLACCRKFLGH